MSCDNYPQEKIISLYEYLETLKDRYLDVILLVVTCKDGSEHLAKTDFRPYANNIADGLEYKEGFAAIIDGSKGKNIQEWKRGAIINCEYSGHEFSIRNEGSTNASDEGYVCFTVDREEFRLKDGRRLNALLFSKSMDQILDLFSVDIRDPALPVKKASKEVFDLERRLISNEFDNPADRYVKREEKKPGKIFKWMRKAVDDNVVLVKNLRGVVPNIMSRIASLYIDGKYVDQDYSIALKWVTNAIDRSNIKDDELSDNESVYHAVNQFLSKRNPSATLSEKEMYFLNIPMAGGKLRLLQMNAVILLKMFDEICEKHGLTYWAIAGTLLGAIRHKGFIPWDDDVDVGMLRPDIYKLEKIIKEEYPNIKFEKKVHSDRRDTFRHYKIALEGQECAFIDIFAFDVCNIPVDKLEGRIRSNKDRIRRFTDQYKHKNGIKEWASLNDEQRAGVITILSVFSEGTDALCIDKGRSIGYGADTLMPLMVGVSAYDTKTIFPCKSTSFENIEIKIPSNYHLFLESYFGDYYTISNAFSKKRVDLTPDNIRDIKKIISKYSQYILESDAD